MRQLAKRSGMSHVAIGDVINRQRRPTFEWCDKVSKAMGVPPVQLFRMAGLLAPRMIGTSSPGKP